MKRFIICTLLVVAFGVYNHAQAQFKNSNLAWGLSLGGAQGTNSPEDRWVMQGRGFLQIPIFSPALMCQVGLGYTNLEAPNVSPGVGAGVAAGEPIGYTAEIVIVDFRLLYSPLTLANFDPYIYAGLGVSKTISISGSGVLPMVPIGVGIQTKVSSGVLLLMNVGYNLSLSDKLDGRARTENYTNDFTSGKHDGFYGFSIGAAFTLGSGDEAANEAKKKELAEAQARSAKMQAEAEARRIKQQADADAAAKRAMENSDAAAKLAKEKADADAKLAKEKADADAKLAKEKADADAKLAKEKADAEARRLAEQQKSRTDTLIILEKGKRVVLRGVNFETNKATLTRYSENILWRAYNAMVANPNVQVVITGHTDNVGSDKANQILSLKRAQAVKNWLVQKGIASNRMRTVGKGEAEPVASNETNEGRLENRRIEFYTEK